MKYYLRLGFILLIIAAVASGVLAFINSFTKPKIEKNERIAKEKARKQVLPQAAAFENFTTINEEKAYIAKDTDGKIIGFTFVASKYGYSSDVKTMVGLDTAFQVKNIKIISQSETPGLGANATSTEWQQQFTGKNIKTLAVDKDGGNIDSITGATITSRAVTNSIKDGIKLIKKDAMPRLKKMKNESTVEDSL